MPILSRPVGLRPLTALLIAITLVFAASEQFALTSPWWLELSRYLPYPVFLAPPVLALGLSAFLGRGWRAASVAAVLLVAIVTMDFHWHFGEGELPAGGRPVRLMTYNIKAYKAVERRDGFEALGREVALRDPDILVMQDTQTNPEGSIFDASGPIFGLPNVFVTSGYIVAARVPLRDCATRLTPDGRFAFVSCVVEVGGRAATVVTAHFESPRRGLVAAKREGLDGAVDWQRNYAERLMQSRGLATVLESSPRPLIVAGDLNAPEASPVVGNLLGLGLRDAFSAAGTGYGYSYGDALPLRIAFLRIDHILVSDALKPLVTACVIDKLPRKNERPSDHAPVMVTLID